MTRLLPSMFILSLLFVQVAGVHLHVDVGHEDSESVHAVHVEQTFSDHHVADDNHIDVDVNETATKPHLKAESLGAALSIALSLDLGARPSDVLLPIEEESRKQLVHYRPPLRAPPAYNPK